MDNATPSLPDILENIRSLDSSALNKLFETTIPQSRTPKPCAQNRKGPQCNQTESTWCGGMKPKYITHRGERNGTNATGRRDL